MVGFAYDFHIVDLLKFLPKYLPTSTCIVQVSMVFYRATGS